MGAEEHAQVFRDISLFHLGLRYEFGHCSRASHESAQDAKPSGFGENSEKTGNLVDMSIRELGA